MTFKDKESEIKAFIEDYTCKALDDLYLGEFFKMKGFDYIALNINGEEFGIFMEDDHVRFDPFNTDSFNKYEIKFIYDFIEFLEKLGFKEGDIDE